MKNALKDFHSGFSIIQAILTLSFISIIGAAIPQLSKFTNKSKRVASVKSLMLGVRAKALAQLSDANNYIGGRSLANLNPAICQRLTGGLIYTDPTTGSPACGTNGTPPNFGGNVVSEALYYPKVLGSNCNGAVCGVRVASIIESSGSSIDLKIVYEGTDVLVADVETTEDIAAVNNKTLNCTGDQFLSPQGKCVSLNCDAQPHSIFVPPSNSQILNGRCQSLDLTQQVQLCPDGKIPSAITWTDQPWKINGNLAFAIRPSFTCEDPPFDPNNMSQSPTFVVRNIASTPSEELCPPGSRITRDADGDIDSCSCPTGSSLAIDAGVQKCLCETTRNLPTDGVCP